MNVMNVFPNVRLVLVVVIVAVHSRPADVVVVDRGIKLMYEYRWMLWQLKRSSPFSPLTRTPPFSHSSHCEIGE